MSAAPLLSATELERLRLQVLEFWQRERRRGSLSSPGPFPALWHGQGLELHDRRPYQPGDDVRHLDWRATARSRHPYTKVYLAERGRSLFLVLDRRPAMRFATRGECKAASAARIAAILAYTALHAGESVAGLILEEHPRYFPPAATAGGLTALLLAAAAPLGEETAATPDLQGLWHEIAARCGPGTELCLISDFSNLEEFPAAALQALAARCNIHAFQVRDAGEAVLPDLGWLRLRAPGGVGFLVASHDRTLRRRYREAMAQHQTRLEERLAGAAIPLSMVYNHRDTFLQLTASRDAGNLHTAS